MVFSQCVFRAPETAGFQLWFLLGSVGKAPDSPSLKWLCLSLLLHNSTYSVQFSHSVVSDSLWPPWTAACQASLSITNSWSLLKPMNCLTGTETPTRQKRLTINTWQPDCIHDLSCHNSENCPQRNGNKPTPGLKINCTQNYQDDTGQTTHDRFQDDCQSCLYCFCMKPPPA